MIYFKHVLNEPNSISSRLGDLGGRGRGKKGNFGSDHSYHGLWYTAYLFFTVLKIKNI